MFKAAVAFRNRHHAISSGHSAYIDYCALCQAGMNEPIGFNNLSELFCGIEELIKHERTEMSLYVLDMNFYGHFILTYLQEAGYESCVTEKGQTMQTDLRKEGKDRSYTYTISKDNIFYSIFISYQSEGKTFFLRVYNLSCIVPYDAMKIQDNFPCGVRLSVEEQYDKDPSQDIINKKAIILASCVKSLYDEGLTGVTIGSCCISNYKKHFRDRYRDKFVDVAKSKVKNESSRTKSVSSATYRMANSMYGRFFVDLRKYRLSGVKRLTGARGTYDAEDFVRQTYKGGICLLNEGKEGLRGKGVVADINSAYSYVMHSDNGNPGEYGRGCFPVGYPKYYFVNSHIAYTLNSIEDIFGLYKSMKKTYGTKTYIFSHIICSFDLKKGHVPFIRITDDARYDISEILKTSRVDGKDIAVDLYITEDELTLLFEQYNVRNFMMCEMLVFATETGLFDSYIDYWQDKKIKAKKEGNLSEATIAKLMCNNLPGKFASKPAGEVKKYDLCIEDGTLVEDSVQGSGKNVFYIPVSAAVNSKQRVRLVRDIQRNFDRFCYCDTDCMILDGEPEDVKVNRIDDYELGAYKFEHIYDEAFFIRKKLYALREGKNYSLKCSGLSRNAIDLVEQTMRGDDLVLKDIDLSGVRFFNENKGKGFDLIKDGFSVPCNRQTVFCKGGAYYEYKEFIVS